MKVVKRNRYYCDFCKKSGGSSGHMKKHETGCTNNPNRVCGVCRATGGRQKPLDELLLALSEDIRLHGEKTKDWDLWEAVHSKAEIRNLRDATENCPACILAAIRQTKEFSYVEFDFKTEIESYWREHSDAAQEEEIERHRHYG